MTEKSLPQPSSPQVKDRRAFPFYAVLWTTAAGLSLLYLILLATQPTLVAHYLGAGTETSEASRTQQAVDEAVAEVRTLRGTIDQFRSELFEIRAQVSSQSESARGLSDKVAALEMDRDDPQRAVKAAAEQAKAKEAAVKEAAAKEASAKKAAKEAAAKEAKKLAASKQTPGLETGSVAQPATGAITFGPPTVTPAAADPASGDLVGVAIATGPSVDSLRLSWTLLNERHGGSLRAFEPRYTTDISGSEQSYDLVVGPVASVDDAKRLCQELAMKATPCRVSRFTGDAL